MRLVPIDIGQTRNPPKTERGRFGAYRYKMYYDAADDGSLYLEVDTCNLGAGSIAFTIDNRHLPQGGTVRIYVHNGEAASASDTANMTEVNFKDLTGTATGPGAAIAGGVTAVFTLTENTAITAGTYKLDFNELTSNLAFNANAATIQAALEALSTIGPGNVSVTGGPVNTAPVVITLLNDLALQNVQSLGSEQTSLTGTFDITEDPVGSDGEKGNYIITYASYPEVMSSRIFVLKYTPDAAMGVDVEIPVFVSIK